MSYEEVLQKTDPAKIVTVESGSAKAKAALERFCDLFAALTEENIRAKVRDVYADGAYLNDNLKEIHGIDEIEAYFIRSARETEMVSVKVTDVAESNGNYYLRWVMAIQFKKLKRGEITKSIGISHVRFNAEGKVVLHQDYWDSARGFFDHVPIVGKVLDSIRKRL